MSGELSVFQRFKDSRAVRQARIMLGLEADGLGAEKPQGAESPVKKLVSTAQSSREPDWRNFEGCYSKALLPHSSNPEKTVQFLAELFDILQDYIQKENDRSNKVLDFHHPHQLREILDHCIEVDECPRDLEQILSDCKETLKYCVKTGHPRFFNQLSSGLDVIGMAGEWLTATANTNMFTYEVAPVFTLMEDIILSRMRSKVGWTEGDGILVPGGALANLYSVLAARYNKVPDVKVQGMKALPQLVMFTSEQGHFSIKRSAAIMGIGTDNVIQIRCDERGKMVVSELESAVVAAISRGCLPFYVNATCGTTVLGAYDPVQEIADVCQKHGLWLHIDGAWGGSVLMSNKHRHLLDGIERANSMTWNPHKLMGVPLQCSAILLRDKGILQACNSMQANYLFQQDKNYDMGYDTGDKAIQCGRHNDIFKLWLMWRSKGDRGFEDHVNKVFEHAEYLRRKIKGRDGFEFVVEKGELTNVCFWYVPPSMRALQAGTERDQRVNTVAPKIKARMMESGSTLVGYQPLGNLPNFFRMVISNPGVTEADLDFFVDEIERLGRDI